MVMDTLGLEMGLDQEQRNGYIGPANGFVQNVHEPQEQPKILIWLGLGLVH
jgi:hypothetical protein